MKTLAPAALLAILLALSAGCIDEDKTDCRTHADCRGVRLCEDGACYTPEQYDDPSFEPRYDDEEPPDQDGSGADGTVVLPLSAPPAHRSAGEGAPTAGTLLELQIDTDLHVVTFTVEVDQPTPHAQRVTVKVPTRAGLDAIAQLAPGDAVALEPVGRGLVVHRLEGAP